MARPQRTAKLFQLRGLSAGVVETNRRPAAFPALCRRELAMRGDDRNADRNADRYIVDL